MYRSLLALVFVVVVSADQGCPSVIGNYEAKFCVKNEGNMPHFEHIDYSIFEHGDNNDKTYGATRYVQKFYTEEDCKQRKNSALLTKDYVLLTFDECPSVSKRIATKVIHEGQGQLISEGKLGDMAIKSKMENCPCGGYEIGVYKQIDDFSACPGQCSSGETFANFWLEGASMYGASMYWGSEKSSREELEDEDALTGHGSAKQMVPVPADLSPECEKWSNWCKSGNEWMENNCQQTCSGHSVLDSCEQWKEFCGKNDWMTKHCKRTCLQGLASFPNL